MAFFQLHRRLFARVSLLLGIGLLLGFAVQAMENPDAKPDRNDPRSKLDGALLRELAHPERGFLRKQVKSGAMAGAILLRLNAAPEPATLAAISGLGIPIIHQSLRWHEIQVEATPAQAVSLAQIPGVSSVRVAWRPFRRASAPVIDQADAVLHTDTLRTTYGATGSGVKMGIISDSLNHTASVGQGTLTGSTLTNTIPQLSGDLPASITVVDGTSTGQGQDTDEGAAMMEEAFKLAPGSGYAFATCGNSDVTMADNITALAGAGCKIICDDIGFLDEPMFQDGPIAQAINTFVSGGGLYFSAAGNSADQAILTPYVDIHPSTNDVHAPSGIPDGNDFHNWFAGTGTASGFLPITVTPDPGAAASLLVTMEWNQPFGSNGLGGGAQSDYDLYLYNANNLSATLLDKSEGVQGTVGHGQGDPFEWVQTPSPITTPTTVYLAVNRYNTAITNDVLRLIFNVEGGTITFPPNVTGYPSGSIAGHPAATGALAIAAVPYTAPTTVEYFSSKGGWGSSGLPFYFDSTGAALSGAPQLRNKPDLSAPDGVSTSLAGFTPFYGTSGATPHAAAAAALLWSLFPSRLNSDITNLLISSCTDVTVSPASTGPDAWTGHGLINAAAAAAGAGTPVSVSGISASPANTTCKNGTVSVQVTFSAPVVVTGNPLLLLNTSPARSAVYSSGSGTATLTFIYTLQSGDTTNLSPLDATSTSALTLAGGTISGAGLVNLAIPQGSSVGSLASAGIVINAKGPGLTIAATPSLSNQPTFTCTFTFSAPVTGFAAGAVTVTNGSLSAFSGSGSSYQATVTATAVGLVSIAVPGGSATDQLGFPSFAAATSVTFDNTPPTLTLSAPTSVQLGGNVQVRFNFSKPVTGFTQNQITLTGGQVLNFSGSGAAYLANFTASQAGTLSVTVPVGSATDLFGNALAQAASASVTVTSAPATAASSDKSGGGMCGLGGGIAFILALFFLARIRFF